jgi:hypothetical protein
VCVPTWPRRQTSKCGCGGGGSHPCPISRELRPVRQAAKRAYRPPIVYTSQDVEDLERELYGNEAEQSALRDELEVVGSQVKAVGGLHERGFRGRSAAAQARRAQDLRNRNQSVGRGYTVGGSEQGYADLLGRRAELIAHGRHLRAEEVALTKLLKTLRRAVERSGGRMTLTERRVAGLARRLPRRPHRRG